MKKDRQLSKTGETASPKSRAVKKPIITRAEARRRAERHVLNRIFRGAQIRDGAEAVLHVYQQRAVWNKNDVWVVYKNPRDLALLQSSDVVVVCKRTGRVLYEGSACDEG